MPLLTPGLGYIIWTFFAFILVLIILKKFAWKPILQSLKERENSISEAIASAEKVKVEMAQLRNENETLMAKAREERAQMLKEAKDTGDKLVHEAREKAKKEYDRILEEAQIAIQQQKNAAMVEVKNEVGNLVIEVAEKVLRKQLAQPKEQENFIKELAETVKLN